MERWLLQWRVSQLSSVPVHSQCRSGIVLPLTMAVLIAKVEVIPPAYLLGYGKPLGHLSEAKD